MTKLELAFTEAAKLSPSEQDALAEWILEDLTSENRWEEVFLLARPMSWNNWLMKQFGNIALAEPSRLTPIAYEVAHHSTISRRLCRIAGPSSPPSTRSLHALPG